MYIGVPTADSVKHVLFTQPPAIVSRELARPAYFVQVAHANRNFGGNSLDAQIEATSDVPSSVPEVSLMPSYISPHDEITRVDIAPSRYDTHNNIRTPVWSFDPTDHEVAQKNYGTLLEQDDQAEKLREFFSNLGNYQANILGCAMRMNPAKRMGALNISAELCPIAIEEREARPHEADMLLYVGLFSRVD